MAYSFTNSNTSPKHRLHRALNNPLNKVKSANGAIKQSIMDEQREVENIVKEIIRLQPEYEAELSAKYVPKGYICE